MNDYEDIFKFFIRLIDLEPILLSRINNSKREIFYENGSLIFGLSGLYNIYDPNELTSFKSFKKKLYSSGLNERLAPLGYKISIYKSTGKIETSLYMLQPLTT